MKVDINDNEKKLLTAIARSAQGEQFVAFLQKVVTAVVDIRNIESAVQDLGTETKARSLAAKIIEENLIERLKGLAKDKSNSPVSEFE